MRRIFFSLLVIVFLGASLEEGCASPMPKDPIEGLWYTEGREGGVELYRCADKICGRFAWVDQKPGEDIARDDKNPDASKRKRPLCHMEFMTGFVPDGQTHYNDGAIYSPRHGQIFNAEITQTGADTLDLHGYILTPILGESQTWTRAKSFPKCVTHE